MGVERGERKEDSLSVGVDVVLSLRESPDNRVGGPENEGEDGKSDVGLADGVRSEERALSASNEEPVDLATRKNEIKIMSDSQGSAIELYD